MNAEQTPKHQPHMRRCDRHGVLFNDEHYNSCAVCRASSDAPKLAVSSLLFGLAGIGLIGCGVVMAGGPAVKALADAGDRAIAETAQAMRLDPNPIRVEIESLEALVYLSAPEADKTGPDIRAAASVLAESIAKLGGAPRPLLNRFSREIEAFGARSDPRHKSDPSSHGLTTSVDWETVRSRVFAEAQWYRHIDTARTSITTEGSIAVAPRW